MIKFDNTEVVGWEAAIRGMRNPLESWDRSDSDCINDYPRFEGPFVPYLGPNDLNLMRKLCNAGTDHRKFMRMIVVYVDITAPVYWVAQLDTYKVATVRNSCSFMHKGASRTYTVDDFSWHGLELDDPEYVNAVLNKINFLKDRYVETKDPYTFQQLRDVVPQGQNVKFTYMCNYETLANIYKSRKDHKLDEWHEFCDWIRELPYSELIVGKPSRKDYTFADAVRNLKNFAETYEKQHTPSPEEIDKLFKQVVKLDERIDSYGVFDMDGMKILDFYDGDHNSLYAVDLYRATLSDTLAFIKQQVVKRT